MRLPVRQRLSDVPSCALAALVATLACARCSGGDGGGPVPGVLVIEPSFVEFGRTFVGFSKRATIVLKNVGAGAVTISEAHPDPEFFDELRLEGVPAALLAGEEHSVELVFEPSSRGVREGTVTFATDSRASPLVSVLVLLDAAGPRLLAEPRSIDFGRWVIGRTATASVMLVNDGDLPISVNTVTPDLETSSEFVAALDAILQLPPGGRALLSVAYLPRDIGSDVGRLLIADDPSFPERLAIALRGEGTITELEVDPTSIRFAGLLVGEARTKGFAIRNLSDRIEILGPFTLEGVFGDGEFHIDGVEPRETGLLEIGPGDERWVGVTYAPMDDDPDDARIRFPSSGLGRDVSVALSGAATRAPTPELGLSVSRLSFGSVRVGSTTPRPIQISNLGTADLRLSGLVEIRPTSSPYVLTRGPPSDAILAPLDSHMFSVEFSPQVVGSAPAAELWIRTNDPDARLVRVGIEGSGQVDAAADLALSPLSLDFGRVSRGTSAQRAVELRNVGSALLNVYSVAFLSDSSGRFSLASLPAVPATLDPGRAIEFSVGYFDPIGLPVARSGTIRVVSDDPDQSSIDLPLAAVTRPPSSGPIDLSIELTWDRFGTNLDLHLVRPGGAYFDRPSDCCRCDGNPDWGAVGDSDDDPVLDRDDLDGLLPENIRLAVALTGAYQVVVHHYSDRGLGPAIATVAVRSRGTLLGTFSQTLGDNQRWNVGTVWWDASQRIGTILNPSTPVSTSTARSCF